MIQLTKGTNVLDINLSDFSGAGQDVVQNGSFDNVGSDLIQNGSFSEIGPDLVGNGEFNELGTDVITNGGFTGTELVTNGDFLTDLSGWTLSASTPPIWDDGMMKMMSDGATFSIADQSFTTSIGTTYSLVFDKRINTQNLEVKIGTSQGNSSLLNLTVSTVQIYTYTFTATSETSWIRVRDGGSSVGAYITDISVKEVGEDWTNGTGWSFGVDKAISTQALGSEEVTNGDFSEIGSDLVTNGDFSAVPLGSELITNGDFATDTGWSKGTGWTISGGTANCDASQTSTTNLNNTTSNGLINGKTYKVVYTISNFVDGSIRIKLGNTGFGTSYSSDGTYVEYITALVTTFPYAQFNADVDFNGSIDNVSVKEVLNLVDNPNFTDTGSELVTNGDFATAGTPTTTSWSLGWSIVGADGGGANITGGELVLDRPDGADSNYNRLYATNGSNAITGVVEVGKSYKLTYTVTAVSGSTTFKYINGGAYADAPSSLGTHVIYYVCTVTANFGFRNSGNDSSITLDNVSVKELGADWTLIPTTTINEDGATIEGLGSLTSTGNNWGVSQVVTGHAVGKSYKVTFTAKQLTGVGVMYGGIGYVNQFSQVITADYVTYTFYQTITTSGTNWNRVAFGGILATGAEVTNTFEIKDVSVKELGEGWTVQDGWSIGDSKAVFDDTQTNYIAQNSPSFAIGNSYKVTFEIQDCASTCNVTFYNRSHSVVFIANENWTNGTYTRYVTSTVNSEGFSIWGNTALDSFSITNITVQEVGQGWTVGDKWTISEVTGARLVSDNSDVSRLSQAGVFEIGKNYKVTLDAVVNSGSAKLENASGLAQFEINTTQTYVEYFVATGTGFNVNRVSTISDIYINNISVKEIATSYLTQAVSLSAKTWKIIYSVSDYIAGSVSATDYGAVTTANAVGITEYVQIGVASDFRMVNIGGYFEGAVTGISAQLVDPNGYWYLNSATNAVSIGEDKAIFTNASSGNNIQQIGWTIEVGKYYKCTFDIPSLSLGTLRWMSGSGLTISSDYTASATSITFYFQGDGSNGIYCRAVGTTTATLTNISVEQLDPNDYWTLGTGAALGTNELNVNNGDGLVAYQPSILDATGYYIISFLVSDYSQGFIKGYVSNVTGDAISSNGSHTQYIQGSSTADVGVYCTDNFIGNVTDIVVKQFDTNNRWVTFASPNSKSVMKLGQVDLEIDSSSNNCGVYQTGLIKPNKLYIVTINMKATAAVRVEIAASLGTTVSAVIGTTVLTTEYKEYSFEYVTPFDVAHDLQIHRFFGSGPNQTISIDYVSMNGVDESQWINDPTWDPFATSLVYVPTLTDESTNNSKQFTLDTSIADGGWDGRSLHGQVTINESAVEDPANGIINLKQPNFLEGFYQVEIRGYLGTFYRILGKGMAHLKRASTEDGYNRFEAYNDSVTYKAYEE